MKLLIALGTMLFAINSFALDCTSVGATSCSTNDGICFEYLANMSTSQVQSLCSSMGGTFSNTPCDLAKFNKGTCVSEMNPMMSIFRFDENFDSESAQLFCTSMSGQFCQ
jgi:hypothetical protein